MAGSVSPEFRGARRRLVETLQAAGIRDLAVLRAVDLTPRHLFVPTGVRHRAYEDSALPIGNGQTISQPSVHARYLELLGLTGNEKVLEVGTGTGYQTVLLSHLAAQVFSIERVPALENMGFRVVDERTLQASLNPVKAGVVVFNLKDKRIVQIHNTYNEIRRKGKVRIVENGQPTNRVRRYELPPDWSLVPGE